MLHTGLRASLWLALLPASLLSFVVTIGAGLRIDLWRWDRPLTPLLLLAIALFPLAIASTLVRTRAINSTRTLAEHALFVWTSIMTFVAFVIVWLPQPVYDNL